MARPGKKDGLRYIEPHRGPDGKRRKPGLTAALRALKQTGHEVQKIEVDPDGKVHIILGKPAAAEPAIPKISPGKQKWLDAIAADKAKAEQVWVSLAPKKDTN